MLVDAVKGVRVTKVLDLGCGAGQEMLPFLEKTDAFCVGVDVADEIGETGKGFFRKTNFEKRVVFVRACGEKLPFADGSFDLLLCRLALPYMDNREAIAEFARVLRPEGVVLLKTHAPAFYFGMLQRRWKKFSLRQIAYPLICLAGGAWHLVSGRQPRDGFWKGKEVFQTKGFLEREFSKNNLSLKSHLPDTNVQTPSFVVEKIK